MPYTRIGVIEMISKETTAEFIAVILKMHFHGSTHMQAIEFSTTISAQGGIALPPISKPFTDGMPA